MANSSQSGIVVPEVLRRFIPGQPERLNFVKVLPDQPGLPSRNKEIAKK
jgi:hypothetical protein